jgi:hypothetical protein
MTAYLNWAGAAGERQEIAGPPPRLPKVASVPDNRKGSESKKSYRRHEAAIRAAGTFDLETTGMPPDARVCEVGWCDPSFGKAWSVQPSQYLSQELEISPRGFSYMRLVSGRVSTG